ncbi:MAG TPA: sulfatase-like hydrolase/transferase [Clostridiaceae bacterium]|nr:sulfatase-like hydrolase/transferase [Clostridiaceae bacterium]
MNEKKPNIIFILSDDQGAWALGCAGNHEIITPNIDGLAKRGMMFSNFYCVSPVCSPARASLLTGKIPSQHGVHDWITHNNNAEISSIDFLEGQICYTDILKKHGYVCGLSGKWHLGNSLVPHKSFDHWYAHTGGGGPYYNAPMVKDGVIARDPRYITDLITDDAIGFIKKCTYEGKPFYLSVNYTAPHSPWLNNHPKEYLDLYKDCPFETCPQEKEHPFSIFLTKEVAKDIRGNLTGYFASVTAMDANIGRIISTLEELSVLENTVVIFSSDNGFSCGQHGFWGKGNGTYPLNMYETSVKVPFIISHPGHIKENEKCDMVLSAYDFMPTLLDYLNISNQSDANLPGKSFAPLLCGENCDCENQAVVFNEYGPVRMIRQGDWKFIKRYPYGPNELYNLMRDPGEKENQVNEKPYLNIAREMNEILERWFDRYVIRELDGSRLPVFGSGQLCRPSYSCSPDEIFFCDDYIKETEFYKSSNNF